MESRITTPTPIIPKVEVTEAAVTTISTNTKTTTTVTIPTTTIPVAAMTVAAALATATEPEFNAILFEKKLMQLKDSQESINTMSHWCLDHRMHHKKIVIAWLSVLKKVKVEQRLTLFYLANDVIQYSKRKNYDFVESWGTTLQKATTLVREEKVKNRILRIFKIWEQRGIYGEEFIADLSGLISASPSAQKLNQDPQDFQPTYLISRIRSCAKLEADTDLKLKNLKDSNPKITDSETLCASLKDRRHVEDVEKEVESGITLFEGYVNALKAEIKSRTHLISCLTQADTFYHEERKEVKVVVNAYKNFTSRVKNLQKKLKDLTPNLTSPIPSPDVNAPSPEPDSDNDLPPGNSEETNIKCAVAAGVSVFSVTDTYSANYYTPTATVATTQPTQDNFTNNGFSSFMGSSMPFDLQNFNFTDPQSQQTQHQDGYSGVPVPPPTLYDPSQPYNNTTTTTNTYNNQQQQQQQSNVYNPASQQPLLPPPMPPFTTTYNMETPGPPYTDTTYADSYVNNSNYEPVVSTPYAVSSEVQQQRSSYPPPPLADAYNPEEEVETWEPEAAWDAPPDLETPESPPMFEKESFTEPIEYDDSKTSHSGLLKDVDHRVLLPPPQIPHNLTGEDTDLRRIGGGPKDVDHRNLISLTGSPTNVSPGPTGSGLLQLQPPPAPPTLWSELGDQDYRAQDQDYRDIARQLKLPPPPPPPPKTYPKQGHQHQDNVESIDMDLSDDENTNTNPTNTSNTNNLILNSDCIMSSNNSNSNNMNSMLNGNRNIVTLVENNHQPHQMNCPPPMAMMGPMHHPPPPNWLGGPPPGDFIDHQFNININNRGNFPPPLPQNKFEFRGGGGGGSFGGPPRNRGQYGRGGGANRSRPMFRGGPNGRGGNFNNRGGVFRGGKFRGAF